MTLSSRAAAWKWVSLEESSGPRRVQTVFWLAGCVAVTALGWEAGQGVAGSLYIVQRGTSLHTEHLYAAKNVIRDPFTVIRMRSMWWLEIEYFSANMDYRDSWILYCYYSTKRICSTHSLVLCVHTLKPLNNGQGILSSIERLSSLRKLI